MATAFFLTPAETRLIESLLAGRSLRETTGALGVAMTTAKTHLEKAKPHSTIPDRPRPMTRKSRPRRRVRCAQWCARSERPGGLKD